MNDHDAMTAINEVLDLYFRGELIQEEAFLRICFISAQNSIDHAEAKKASK